MNGLNLGLKPVLLALFVLTSTLGGMVHAQSANRPGGPQGSALFADGPQQGSDVSPPGASGPRPVSPTQAAVALPFELRQLLARFPVVLYSGEPCSPCNSARSLLKARGIPYTEYTVSSMEDAQALKMISGDTALPVVTVGKQLIRGFDERELRQFLDLAGYPKNSILPSGYRQPAATALVAPVKPVDKGPPIPRTDQNREEAKPPLPENNPANPAGIRF